MDLAGIETLFSDTMHLALQCGGPLGIVSTSDRMACIKVVRTKRIIRMDLATENPLNICSAGQAIHSLVKESNQVQDVTVTDYRFLSCRLDCLRGSACQAPNVNDVKIVWPPHVDLQRRDVRRLRLDRLLMFDMSSSKSDERKIGSSAKAAAKAAATKILQ